MTHHACRYLRVLGLVAAGWVCAGGGTAEAVVRSARGTNKPIVCSFMGVVDVSEGVRYLQQNGYPGARHAYARECCGGNVMIPKPGCLGTE